jgi:hypothetical protein
LTLRAQPDTIIKEIKNMEIVKNSKGMDRKKAYQLTHAMSTRKMQDAVDSILKIDAWVLYTDVDSKTGEAKDVLAIESDGEIFGTISKTFLREFTDIVDAFGDDPELSIRVVAGTSKAGRQFITCEIV